VNAIDVVRVSKTFRIPHERHTTLAERALSMFQRVPADELRALDGVTLSVPAGSCVGVIGANGSGKSTLLKIIAGLLPPDEGTLTVRGTLVPLLELGLGFQRELTVADNASLYGAILGYAPDTMARKVAEAISFAELERFRDAKLKSLSSGMLMRLAFATAVHAEAEVLLFDEILAVGDIAFQRKCMDTLRRLRKTNKTIVLVSHDLNSVQQFCERAYWLDRGRIVDEGDARRLVQTYLNMAQSLGPRRPALDGHAIPDADRMGDGCLRYVSGRLVDRAGSPTTQITAGSGVALRLVAEAHAACVDPVFGVRIRRGPETLYATNTALCDIAIDVIAPGDRVDIEVPFTAALANGQYVVDVAIADRTSGTIHDWVSNALTFMVERSTCREGVADLAATFHCVRAPGRPPRQGPDRTSGETS
jgi:lipopolysaccharide transport system ATP-binding protein